MMAGDHVSFQLRFSPYPQDDKPEQQHETRFHSAPQQYHQQCDLPSFETTTTFPSQDWPWAYNVSGVLTQDVDTSIQRSQLDPLLDLGQPPPQDAVNKLDVQSLVKPAGEAWKPPLLPRSTNATHGYYSYGYARSSGVMSEPFPDEEICSLVESDLVSKLDSGFYSRAPCRKSSSYRQDIYRDDQSEISAMSGYHPAINVARPPAGRIFLSDSQVAGNHSIAHHGRRRRSSQPLPPCSVCKIFVPKNFSDQKKHERKHTKPFKCRFPECVVKDIGFSTDNDRDRHYKSAKHREAPTKGSLKGFICLACTDGKSKWWPRQDNFKAHCNRKHKGWNIEDLMKRSEHDSRPRHTYSEDNNTTFSDPTYQQQAFPQNDFGATYDMAPLRQGEEGLWSDNSAALLPVDELAGVGQALHLTDGSAYRVGPIGADVPFGSYNELRCAPVGPWSMDVVPPFSQANQLGLDHGDFHASPMQTAHSSGLLNKNCLEVATTSSAVSLQSPSNNSDGEGLFKCTYCDKSKRRRCELKKHMKRHTRPYVCTFPSCTSRYGSRSDWKRHEETHHVIQESWLCTARLPDGSKCFINFTSEPALRNHLAVTHRVPTLQITSQLCEDMRLGDEAVDRFWCGFCQDVVSQEPHSGCDPKETRMQHIGDHYDKDDSFVAEQVALKSPHASEQQ